MFDSADTIQCYPLFSGPVLYILGFFSLPFAHRIGKCITGEFVSFCLIGTRRSQLQLWTRILQADAFNALRLFAIDLRVEKHVICNPWGHAFLSAGT